MATVAAIDAGELVQFPGVTASDDQDVTFGIDMTDGTSLAGVPLLLTVREDPLWPRRFLTDETRPDLTGEDDADPGAWAVVVTSSTLASPAPAGYAAGVVVPRASMALLSTGLYRYAVEVCRTDPGNVSPVVPPTYLSVRPAVSRP
jgi:hypothetical protein